MDESLQTPEEIDYEFRRHLRDLVVMLGGKREIAGLIAASIDRPLNRSDLQQLFNYMCELENSLKNRLRDQICVSKIKRTIEKTSL